MPNTVTIKNNKLIIECTPNHAPLVKRIPGVRYSTTSRLWHTDATATNVAFAQKLLIGFTFNLGDNPPVPPPTASKTDTTQPALRTADLWPHQARAYNFAMNCGNAAYLAMKMGTGKTATTIDMICNRVPESGGIVLIVCPASVIPVWVEQIEQWGKSRRWMVHALDASLSSEKKAEVVRRPVPRNAGFIRAFIVNYESVWRAPVMRALRSLKTLDYIVADEAHRIKTHDSAATKGMTALSKLSARRVCLSGTPMAQSPRDIFSQYRFLDPSILGDSITRFREQYEVTITDAAGFPKVVGYKNVDDLEARLGSIMFRLNTTDVLKLPEAVHTMRYVTLEPEALRMHDRMNSDLYAEWQSGSISADNALVKVLRLQQITGGTVTFDDETTGRISLAKRKELVEIFNDLEPDEPVVVFTQFRSELEDIKAACDETSRPFYEQSGRVHEWQDFNAATGGSVLAAQIRSGSEGIHLTRARYCVYYSTGYSLGTYDQSLSRVHRPGQTRDVTYIHIIARGTIDERIQRSLIEHRDAIEAVIGGI